MHNLLERGGGHYIDLGATSLIASGAVSVRGLVEPVAYTSTGLLLSDNSTLDTDAVIWCTGFADKDVRETAKEVLGSEELARAQKDYNVQASVDVLGPKDIVSRLDATWGVDAEGEIRGMWKRHLRMENYWVAGGGFMYQRWGCRATAQQIKLDLMGCLGEAYRATPGVE